MKNKGLKFEWYISLSLSTRLIYLKNSNGPNGYFPQLISVIVRNSTEERRSRAIEKVIFCVKELAENSKKL